MKNESDQTSHSSIVPDKLRMYELLKKKFRLQRILSLMFGLKQCCLACTKRTSYPNILFVCLNLTIEFDCMEYVYLLKLLNKIKANYELHSLHFQTKFGSSQEISNKTKIIQHRGIFLDTIYLMASNMNQ